MARKPRGGRFGRYMRAIRDVGANIATRVRQSRDYFTDLIGNIAGKETAHVRKQFIAAYKEHGKELANEPANFSNFMRSAKPPRVPILDRNHIGKMFLFKYDPKFKETLPYYDRLPLILLMDLYNDGFLGLNLHYLPPNARAMLLDAIVDNEIRAGRNAKEDDHIQFNYGMMKRAAKSNLYKPCVKRYLYNPSNASRGVSSQFLMIPGEEWDKVIFLPFERFAKASTSRVWRDSMSRT